MKRDQHDPLCAWWSIQCDSECAELPYGSSCKHMFCVCDLIAKADARGYSRAYAELLRVEIGTGNAQGGAGHGIGGGPVRPTLGGKP